MMIARAWAGPIAVVVAVALVGCTPGEPTPTPTDATPAASPSPAATAAGSGPVQPVGTPRVIASGLKSPWSVVRLRSGSALISERDTGTIRELTESGTLRTASTVAGVVHSGEGGLLGLEVWYEGDTTWIYAYYTSRTDNRIVRMRLSGTPGDYSLGAQQDILTGLAKAGNHDGGRIKIGPDDHLYATVGDAGVSGRAQDPASPSGKILRLNLDGSVPSDNPRPGSLVYSMGHRNPQGLAWDANGRLWAAEFGQNTWDELNQIEPGANYGWPAVEGIGHKSGFIDPVYQWSTAEASPSGLAYIDGTFFLAALRGQRLWVIHPGEKTDAVAYFTGEYGRLRDAVPGPDGTLWVLTNNTDGRGSPGPNDDRLLQIRLNKLAEG